MKIPKLYRIANGSLYLNNYGSKWICIEDYQKVKVRILPDEYTPMTEPLIRTALYFEALGNFASVTYSYKGKKYSSLNYELITNERGLK